VINFPGVLAYGQTKEEAVARVEALALWVLEETNRRVAESAEREEENVSVV
jgi:predicted RNase H-like HicB family nuclease